MYSVAQSMHAIGSDGPLADASLQAKAIAVYREVWGFLVEESAVIVNRNLETGTWGARPQGGLPEHFASLVKHLGGSVVLLRTNTYSIVASSFGTDSALTSATVWVPGREAPPVPMDVEIWRSIAKGRQWWLLLRRNNVIFMGVVAISGEQSSIIHCR